MGVGMGRLRSAIAILAIADRNFPALKSTVPAFNHCGDRDST